jgi:hypothetical protein
MAVFIICSTNFGPAKEIVYCQLHYAVAIMLSKLTKLVNVCRVLVVAFSRSANSMFGTC